MIRADLHIHTYYSDGLQSPRQVIDAAKEAGLSLIAVTDHDNMNGFEETSALAVEQGIINVRGLEISAYSSVKVHILGYNLDKESAVYKDFFKALYDGAEARTADILSKLKSKGVNLGMIDIERERKCDRSPLHAMHIARAAARKGYGKSPSDFYLSYLNAGKCGYSDIGRVTPEYALEIIRRCGGISSLAHPGRIALDADNKIKLIERLVDCGLDGIEAVYSGHTISETAYYTEAAERYSLLITGGSDTHYGEGTRRVGTPEFYPDERLLSALKII